MPLCAAFSQESSASLSLNSASPTFTMISGFSFMAATAAAMDFQLSSVARINSAQ